MLTDAELNELVARLRRMQGPKDGQGAYLGDGLTTGRAVRSVQIADALCELIELRILVDKLPD
jgi:hypothetical protein